MTLTPLASLLLAAGAADDRWYAATTDVDRAAAQAEYERAMADIRATRRVR